MPEGDTVFLAATRLHAALAGQRLVRTDFRMPRSATADLAGRIVEEVVSRGKHLLLRIAGGVTLPRERRRARAFGSRTCHLLVSKLPALHDLSVSHLRPLRSAACSR